jgi:signal transduction histidine kinase
MNRIILLLLLSSISLFAAKKVVLQLDWLNQFQFAGYYVAKELGYYKDVGLDVEFKEFKNSVNLSDVIKNKEADFAIGRSSLLIDKINGKDIVAMGAIFQESPMILLVRDDSGINSISDLKNKKIMLTKDAKESASVVAMLSSNGITDRDYIHLSHSFNIDDLINGKTDATASYISNEPIQMLDKGVEYRIFDPKDYGFHFYSDILFTSSEFIKNNPKLAKDFYEASIKGWKYAFTHIARTAEMIYKKYNTQNKTLLELIKEGEILHQLAYSKNNPLGYLDEDKLSDIVKVYKVLGLITKDIDLDSFIYEGNHPKKVAFSLSYDEILHISLITVAVLISLFFIILFVGLRSRWLHTQSYLKKKIDDQKEEIESKNRIIMVQSKIVAIGEMLSNIAHQWRQPLNVISLSTAKMETSLLLGSDLKSEDFIKICNEINMQAQYLSQTIDDFRNYFNSNVDSITSFNVNDTVIKVGELTKESFKSNNIQSVVSVEDCTILQNESLLIQALLNIYNNARDAIVENNLEHKYFFINAKCEGDNFIIRLKDSGGGIDENIIEKIFEPYFTTKHRSKGTGLGLYITYGIITEHLNGTIEVHNTEYNYSNYKLSGAEFIISIPTKL